MIKFISNKKYKKFWILNVILGVCFLGIITYFIYNYYSVKSGYWLMDVYKKGLSDCIKLYPNFYREVSPKSIKESEQKGKILLGDYVLHKYGIELLNTMDVNCSLNPELTNLNNYMELRKLNPGWVIGSFNISNITSGFGYRSITNIFTGGMMMSGFHNGYDIYAPSGTPVRVALDGYVTTITRNYKKGYGFSIVISHYIKFKFFGIEILLPNFILDWLGYEKDYFTLYGHMSNFNIYIGEFVKKGSIIGFTGNTGLSTGDHLHYSIFKGKVALDFLKEHPETMME